METPHIPVLLNEVITYLADCLPGEEAYNDKLVIDCTFGAGGYSRAFLEAGARVIALDRDQNAINEGEFLKKQYPGKLELVHARFGDLLDLNLPQPDFIVLDIGVSSMQLDQAERGFSFRNDGPLDMRMGKSEITAADVVNTYSFEKLLKIFRYFGEEHNAKRIANMIVQKREEAPFLTTCQLSGAISEILPKKHFDRIHPATKVFQALRIYVNDELGELIKVLKAAEIMLKEGGRLGVVSFHSLEDRIVKKFFTSCAQPSPVNRYMPYVKDFTPSFILSHKKSIVPSKEEIEMNPRSRSAKLRFGIRTEYSPLWQDDNFNLIGIF